MTEPTQEPVASANTASEDRYDPAAIEPKWQAYWAENETFKTPEDDSLPKKYVLDMFPYPSGAGLHVGHPEGYTATDIVARYLRAKGNAVLHPIGWDAFGLPAEQYAIKTGTHPRVTTEKNIANFTRQLSALGFSYDWSRQVDTTDPNYVKWTQSIFLELFDRGLAYQDEVRVNWCPELGTVLANEEVKDGLSEVGGFPVVRAPLRQWMLKITEYADRLLDGLKDVEWPESTRTMQAEWIGRSEGAEVRFAVEGSDDVIEVFTTRPDTLFGATFLVLAPEVALVSALTTDAQKAEVEAYVKATAGKSDRERQQSKEKTGVFTGGYGINPVNGEKVPVWIADYVLAGYGTGAIMAVPGHDERDFAFAKKFGIPIKRVVAKKAADADKELKGASAKPGIAVNSGKYDGLQTAEFKAKIIEDLEAAGQGKGRIQYKLRDWVFSRQRYWGEPFPIYFPVETEGDPRKGDAFVIRHDQPIAVDRSELPVRLPELEDFKPGDDPAGPLARAVDWRFFQKDGKWFARETNTMPQWAGSCWYYLRYIDPHNDEALCDPEKAKRWLPVDLYVGGAEHAVLHLLYARFWHMVLYDAGLVGTPEPFTKLVHQGMILGEVEYTKFVDPTSGKTVSYSPKLLREGLESIKLSDEDVEKNKAGSFVLKSDPSVVIESRAHKMSKSRGNVINPDVIIGEFGADALRVYEMFMGPLEATKPWATQGLHGVRRFLDRAYALLSKKSSEADAESVQKTLHRTIKKVGGDIESLRLNTAISAMMVLVNELTKQGRANESTLEALAQLLHPFAPHLAEEMWQQLGHSESIQHQDWPSFDPALCEDAVVEVPVQINGKMRGKVSLAKDASEEDALAAANELEAITKQLEGKTMRKVVWVPGRILNLIAN